MTTIQVWNLATERIVKDFRGHSSEIYSLAFSPDGRRLVSGSGDKTARMWCMETGACLYTLAIEDVTTGENGPVDAGVTSVVLSPDGMFLAAASLDTVVRIWDARSGKLVDKLKGHIDSVYSVAFSPDGKILVSGSLDKTLKMWDIEGLRKTLSEEKEEKVKEMPMPKVKVEKDKDGEDVDDRMDTGDNSNERDLVAEGGRTRCTSTLVGHKVRLFLLCRA